MISCIAIHLFYRKKMISFFILLVVMILFMGLLIYPYEGLASYLVDPIYEKMMGKDILIKMLLILFPFLVILIVMDHDQASLKPLIAYFGREVIIFWKMFFYMLLIFSVTLYLWMMFHLLPIWMNYYHFLDDLMIQDFFEFYLDGIILMIFIWVFIREKHKNLAIFIGLCYLLIYFIQEDQKLLILYYLFPFKNSFSNHYSLAYLYKLCYISLGLLISYRYQIKESLS